MKTLFKISLTLSLFFTFSFSYAQNFAPNWSFEDTTNCSVGNNIWFAIPWVQPTLGTSDWFNPCTSSPSGSTVPNNIFGYQIPKTGTCYAGFILHACDIYYREYIQVQLTDSMTAGTKYWVSFFISLADSSEFAITEIGAYFSDTAVTSLDIVPFPFTPQIVSSGNYLDDTSNWKLISGTYVASGGEKYITLGNFNDSVSIDTINVGGGDFYGKCLSYYYIDNICVSPDSLTCDFNTGIQEQSLENFINIFPNPFITSTTININLKFNISDTENYYSLYDLFGRELKRSLITNHKILIKRDNLNNGIYFLKLNLAKKELTKKLIIIN